MRSYTLYQYTAEMGNALTDWGGRLARNVATDLPAQHLNGLLGPPK